MMIEFENTDTNSIVSLFNPVGYLSNKINRKKLQLVCKDEEVRRVMEIMTLHKNVELTDSYNVFSEKIKIDIEELSNRFNGKLNNDIKYCIVQRLFAKAVNLKSFVISDYLFDNLKYNYIRQSIEDRSSYTGCRDQGVKISFMIEDELNDYLVDFIYSLMADRYPCIVSSIENIKHISDVQEYIKIKKFSSIIDIVDEILSSRLVVSYLNKYGLISANCFVPTLFLCEKEEIYKYMNPHQPHVFYLNEFNNKIEIERKFRMAYEFYDIG